MNQNEVHVVSLKPTNNTSSAFSLVLAENDKSGYKGRRMLIVIGSVEAQAIMLAMKDVATPRPLTHELLVNLLKDAKLKITKVEIYREEQGVFFSLIYYRIPGDNKQYVEDARSSDGVALALRVNVPILVTERLLDQQNKMLEECDYENDEIYTQKDVGGQYESKAYSTEEYIQVLERKLKKALDVEDYESASWLRDKIKEIKDGK